MFSEPQLLISLRWVFWLLGAIRKIPAVIETPEGDFIGIRSKMFLSHSYDHRVVNGALGGMFLKTVADYLEGWDINREILGIFCSLVLTLIRGLLILESEVCLGKIYGYYFLYA